MIPSGIISGCILNHSGSILFTISFTTSRYILIEEDLIVNEAVTEDKIARSVNLHGSPTVEVRPSPLSSDSKGGGSLIPDCQWVLDRIADVVTNDGTIDPTSRTQCVLAI